MTGRTSSETGGPARGLRGGPHRLARPAGHITDVGGDPTIHGGQHIDIGLDRAAMQSELAVLRESLPTLPLDPDAAEQAAAALREAEDEAQKRQPRPERIAGAVERMTRIVKDAGGLAAAGAALADRIARVGTLLGPLGHVILRHVRS